MTLLSDNSEQNTNIENDTKFNSEMNSKLLIQGLKTQIKNTRFERDKRLLEWRTYLKPLEDNLANLYLQKKQDIQTFDLKIKELKEEYIKRTI